MSVYDSAVNDVFSEAMWLINGSSYNGTPTDMIEHDGGYLFNGSTSKLETYIARTIPSPFTVFMRFIVHEYPLARVGTLLGNSSYFATTTQDCPFQLRINTAGRLNLQISDGSDWQGSALLSSEACPLNQEMTAAITYDGQIATMYLNDNHDGQISTNIVLSNSSRPYCIGRASYENNDGVNNSQFAGIIKQAAIFTRILSNTELTELHEGLLEPSGSALALLPSGILPQAGDPGVIIGNYFIPMAKPQSGGNDENTRLMLHFDGDIVDNAKGNATPAELTLVNTSVDTENIKFGTGAGKVDAGQIKVQIPDIDLSTVNFVIEGWYYFSSSQSMNHSEQLMNQDFNNNGGWYARRLRDYPARIVLGARGHGDSGTYGTIVLDAWNHIAVVKYSTRVLRLYINGVFAVEYDKSATAVNASIIGVIGPCYHDSSNPDLNEPTTGNVDEVRLQIIPADEILQWTGQVIPISEKPYT